MKIYGDSVIGNIRKQNEDSVLIHDSEAPCFAVVADGMGGAAAGEIASVTTVLAVQKYILDSGKKKITEKLISKAIKYANDILIEKVDADDSLNGMGSTLTFAAFSGKEVLIAQIGDSSAYIFNGQELRKITKDHSYVQHLVDSGRITEQQAKTAPYRNIITRAMGMPDVKADFYSVSWRTGDIIMLCSDGLSSSSKVSILCDILSEKDIELKTKTETLISHALECGGRDNISVILAMNTDDAEVTG